MSRLTTVSGWSAARRTSRRVSSSSGASHVSPSSSIRPPKASKLNSGTNSMKRRSAPALTVLSSCTTEPPRVFQRLDYMSPATALGEKQVVETGRVDVRDAPAVPEHLDGRRQAGQPLRPVDARHGAPRALGNSEPVVESRRQRQA